MAKNGAIQFKFEPTPSNLRTIIVLLVILQVSTECSCDSQLLENSYEEVSYFKEKHLIEACVSSIRTYNIDKAIKLLNFIESDENVQEIVNQVYMKVSVTNFYLIMELIKKVDSPKRMYLLTEALYNQIKKERLPNKEVKILTIFERLKQLENLYKNNLKNNHLKDGILNLITIVKEDLRMYSVTFLKDLLIYKTTKDLVYGNSILNGIYSTDEGLLERIYTDFLLIRTFYYKESVVLDLMQLAKNEDEEGQRKTIIKSYLTAAKSNNYKNLIESMMKLKQHNRYLASIYQSAFNTTLPISVYNLIFANKICIKNVGLNEYLKVGSFIAHEKKRHVYTDLNGIHHNAGLWTIVSVDKNRFKIYDEGKPKESLSVSNNNINGRRAVWLAETGSLSKFVWKFEPIDDYVYVKNYENEYLYGSNNLTDKVDNWPAGHVYSLVGGDDICTHPTCQWLLKDCSQY